MRQKNSILTSSTISTSLPFHQRIWIEILHDIFFGKRRAQKGLSAEYQKDSVHCHFHTTVKLGNKERFDKEQIGVKEPFPVTKY